MDSYITTVEYDPALYDWPPQADIGGPYAGEVGETITFDAENCIDPEDDIVSYEWDFGDGSTDTGLTATHSYEDSGIYTVTLTIMNDKGDIAVDDGSVTIDLWNEGDYWLYDMDEFDIYMEILDYNMIFDVDTSVTDLRLEYESETDTDYILSYNGILDGDINLELSGLKPGLRFARNGQISGTMTIKKGTLDLDEVEYTISGSVNVKWGNLPIPIPLPMSITLSSKFYTPFKFYDFPLEDGKKWTSQSNHIETTISTESSGFNILRLVNTIGTPIMGVPVIPEHSTLRITLRSDRYTCEGSETITVPAGSYEAQKIDFANLVEYYFSEDVNNVVKMSADTGDQSNPLWNLRFNVNGELVETNQ
jgi:PKD repeat protein